jgi:hypothetical protein
MVKRVEQKKRGKLTRRRKKIILIGAEGNNKTEQNYFKRFNSRESEYVVIFAKGNDTDPLKVAKSVYKSSRPNEEDLHFDDGDCAYCVVDTDVDYAKQSKIDEAIKYGSNKHIEVILSNPCFEIWFLQHFTYSTKSFSSNDAVIEELKNYIPSYEKNGDVFDALLPHIQTAKQNALKLEQYHDKVGHRKKSMERNPSSEVYVIIGKIR